MHYACMSEVILVQGFCPLKVKITQFPYGFRLLKKIQNIILRSKTVELAAFEYKLQL